MISPVKEVLYVSVASHTPSRLNPYMYDPVSSEISSLALNANDLPVVDPLPTSVVNARTGATVSMTYSHACTLLSTFPAISWRRNTNVPSLSTVTVHCMFLPSICVHCRLLYVVVLFVEMLTHQVVIPMSSVISIVIVRLPDAVKFANPVIP